MQQEFTPAPAEAESGQERLLDGVSRITQDGFAVGLQDRTTPADLNQAWMTPREPHCVHRQSHASNAEAASAVHGWSCPRGLIELSCPEGSRPFMLHRRRGQERLIGLRIHPAAHKPSQGDGFSRSRREAVAPANAPNHRCHDPHGWSALSPNTKPSLRDEGL